MSARANTPVDSHRNFAGLHIGIDVVLISHVRKSLTDFGDRFIRRLFSAQEATYANESAGVVAERLAARFAAKEATLKAFDLCDSGINWRDIEVVKTASGACRLMLHGRAAELVAKTGVNEVSLSMSHDGDYATAVVAAIRIPKISDCASQAP